MLQYPCKATLFFGLLFLVITATTNSLHAQSHAANYKVDSFPANVGDIAYDPALDDSGYHICNPQVVLQYYNTPSYYKNNKRTIELHFKNRYKPPVTTDEQSGFLTIRFVINCNGQTGRFRLYELDNNYQPHTFNKQISSQLLQLTKELRGWQPASYKGKSYDSYQYITFKLKKGAIECITP